MTTAKENAARASISSVPPSRQDVRPTPGQPGSEGHHSTWQPSYRDSSSPTYSRSTGGYRPVDATLPSESSRLKRWSSLGFVLLSGVAVWGLIRPSTEPVPVDTAVAHVEGLRGVVVLESPDSGAGLFRLLPLDQGRAVIAGSTMRTSTDSDAGAKSVDGEVADPDLASTPADRIGMQLAGGASVRLDTRSRLRLESPTHLVLEKGAVYIDGAGATDVEVRTSLGVVRDIGTQFEVRLVEDPEGVALRVRVREGSVELIPSSGDGEAQEAKIGDELLVHADGHIDRGRVPIHGPEWSWVLSVASLPEVDGRPVSTLLHWIAREGGWRLEYADSGTSENAESVTLHGDLSNLEALAAVELALSSSGMSYRLEDGIFRVSTLGDPAAEAPSGSQ